MNSKQQYSCKFWCNLKRDNGFSLVFDELGGELSDFQRLGKSFHNLAEDTEMLVNHNDISFCDLLIELMTD